jgi:hypothetical protein
VTGGSAIGGSPVATPGLCWTVTVLLPDAAEIVSLLLLVIVLCFAVLRPHGLPELIAAGPAAATALLLGLLTPADALAEIVELGPTVAFLGAILLLGRLAEAEGVFRWLGQQLGARSGGRPGRLLGLTFVAASITTAVLSLDATVVLLTPVVLATTRLLRVPPRPHTYACAHLANSASLLLPVSNLTNLLAFAASGLSFTGFAALMAGPWLLVIAIEYLVFRVWFRAELRVPVPAASASVPDEGLGAPRVALVVLGLTLAGFGVQPGAAPAKQARTRAAVRRLPVTVSVPAARASSSGRPCRATSRSTPTSASSTASESSTPPRPSSSRPSATASANRSPPVRSSIQASSPAAASGRNVVRRASTSASGLSSADVVMASARPQPPSATSTGSSSRPRSVSS